MTELASDLMKLAIAAGDEPMSDIDQTVAGMSNKPSPYLIEIARQFDELDEKYPFNSEELSFQKHMREAVVLTAKACLDVMPTDEAKHDLKKVILAMKIEPVFEDQQKLIRSVVELFTRYKIDPREFRCRSALLSEHYERGMAMVDMNREALLNAAQGKSADVSKRNAFEAQHMAYFIKKMKKVAADIIKTPGDKVDSFQAVRILIAFFETFVFELGPRRGEEMKQLVNRMKTNPPADEMNMLVEEARKLTDHADARLTALKREYLERCTEQTDGTSSDQAGQSTALEVLSEGDPEDEKASEERNLEHHASTSAPAQETME